MLEGLTLDKDKFLLDIPIRGMNRFDKSVTDTKLEIYKVWLATA